VFSIDNDNKPSLRSAPWRLVCDVTAAAAAAKYRWQGVAFVMLLLLL